MFNLIEPFFVLAVSVKFHLTRLSAVACTRFTSMPVYMLSNNHINEIMYKLTDLLCAGSWWWGDETDEICNEGRRSGRGGYFLVVTCLVQVDSLKFTRSYVVNSIYMYISLAALNWPEIIGWKVSVLCSSDNSGRWIFWLTE